MHRESLYLSRVDYRFKLRHGNDILIIGALHEKLNGVCVLIHPPFLAILSNINRSKAAEDMCTFNSTNDW